MSGYKGSARWSDMVSEMSGDRRRDEASADPAVRSRRDAIAGVISGFLGRFNERTGSDRRIGAAVEMLTRLNASTPKGRGSWDR